MRQVTPNIRLRQARLHRHWTQEQVAEHVGASPLSVIRWEAGKTFPNAYYRQQLCQLFAASLEELGLIADDGANGNAPTHGDPLATTPHISPLAAPSLASQYFLGRKAEIDALCQHLQRPGRIALLGLPGVGKTTLATYIAHLPEIQSTHPDGVLWLGFGPHPQLPALLGQIALRLGLPASELPRLASLPALAQRVQALASDRRLLVILDDIWQIENVTCFAITGDHISILLTTRFPIIAHAFALERTVPLAEFDNQQSHQLLTQIAPQVVEQYPDHMQELATAVGGLPLALTLMGWYLQTHQLSGQARRVQAALTRLRQPDHRLHLAEPLPVVDPHRWPDTAAARSLHTVITLSVDHLRAEELALLRTLALFPPKPNQFTEDASCVASGLAAQDYLSALDGLVDAGLVESADSERYHVHQTIADVAQELGRDGSAAERMVHYYIGLMQENRGIYSILDNELANIQAALSFIDRELHTDLWVKGIVALAPLLIGQGLIDLAEDYLTEAILVDTDIVTRCAILEYLSKCAYYLSTYEKTQMYAQELLTLAHQLNHTQFFCGACRLLGAVALSQGDMSAAQSCYEEGLQVAIQEADPHEQLMCALNLGSILANSGHIARAQELFKQGLDLARHNGQREEILRSLISLGTVTGITGRFAEAERYLQEAYALAQQLGLRERIGWIVPNLGNALMVQGHFAEAERYLREGLATARDIHHGEQICAILVTLSEVLAIQGTLFQAEQCAQEGITLARTNGPPQRLCDALVKGGDVAYQQGHVTLALERLNESFELAQHLGLQRKIAEIQQHLGKVAFQRGQLSESKALFQDALRLSQAEHYGETQVMAMFGLAQVMDREKDREGAQQYARIAITQAQEMSYYLADEIQLWLEQHSSNHS
jgi:tetratricopeptide (TPR) repeat protein/transcriptional regulator with XRE-family HTH domain